MTDGTGSSDGTGSADGPSTVDRYLTAPVSAVVAFVLAVLALMGQNALSLAVGAFTEPATAGGLAGFYLGFGLSLLAQVALVFFLARRALAGGAVDPAWASTLARAAVVLAALALVAGLLTLIGGTIAGAGGGR